MSSASTYPFKRVPVKNVAAYYQWTDRGTGGTNWRTFVPASGDANYAIVGDVAADNNTETTFTWGDIVTVPKNDPSVAKPAARMHLVKPIGTRGVDGALNIFEPICEDSNYIAVGFAARSDVGGVPNPASYYCVNKAFVVQYDSNEIIIPDDVYHDGLTLYRTISGTYHFSPHNIRFELIPLADAKKYCTTAPSENYSMTHCSEFMPTLCTVDDINVNIMTENSYMCQTWASRDTIPYSDDTLVNPNKLTATDRMKSDYCTMHPNDKICECMNASQTAGYTADVAKYPLGTSRACLSSLCRNRADGYKPFLLYQDTIDQKTCPAPKPTNVPPVSKPPVSPPVYQPPVTQPPVTQPPVTQPPGYSPPANPPPANPPADSSDSSSSNTAIYIVLAFIALIVIVIIAIRRRKKPAAGVVAKPESTPMPTAVN